ncbi:MAG TPA: hypothetical protein VFE86_07500 [Ilumatobacteraceae bacterium]|nr:hypothetical protein [Ilumatobacteraceae bacterium]
MITSTLERMQNQTPFREVDVADVGEDGPYRPHRHNRDLIGHTCHRLVGSVGAPGWVGGADVVGLGIVKIREPSAASQDTCRGSAVTGLIDPRVRKRVRGIGFAVDGAAPLVHWDVDTFELRVIVRAGIDLADANTFAAVVFCRHVDRAEVPGMIVRGGYIASARRRRRRRHRNQVRRSQRARGRCRRLAGQVRPWRRLRGPHRPPALRWNFRIDPHVLTGVSDRVGKVVQGARAAVKKALYRQRVHGNGEHDEIRQLEPLVGGIGATEEKSHVECGACGQTCTQCGRRR